jgi:hypothetical protein
MEMSSKIKELQYAIESLLREQRNQQTLTPLSHKPIYRKEHKGLLYPQKPKEVFNGTA